MNSRKPQPGDVVGHVQPRDGYEWILEECSDLDKADHAAHLDDGYVVLGCWCCEGGYGRGH